MSDQAAIVELKAEMTKIAAENLAVQFVITCVLQGLGSINPTVRQTILHAFDDAANVAENFSMRTGAKAGHLPETLRVIEQMRLMLVGKDKPTREV